MKEFKALLKHTNIKYTMQYLEYYFSLIKLKKMEISIFQQKNLQVEFPFKKKMVLKKLGIISKISISPIEIEFFLNLEKNWKFII